MSTSALVVERNGERWLHWADEVEDTGEIRPGIVRHAAEGWFSRGVRSIKEHGVLALTQRAIARMARPHRKVIVVSDDATQFDGTGRLEDMDTPVQPLPNLPDWQPEPILPGTYWHEETDRLALAMGGIETVPVTPGRDPAHGLYGTRIIDQVSEDLTEMLRAVREMPEVANAEAHPPKGYSGARRTGWRAEARGFGASVGAKLNDAAWHQAAQRTAITVAAWAGASMVASCALAVINATFRIMF